MEQVHIAPVSNKLAGNRNAGSYRNYGERLYVEGRLEAMRKEQMVRWGVLRHFPQACIICCIGTWLSGQLQEVVRKSWRCPPPTHPPAHPPTRPLVPRPAGAAREGGGGGC